MAINSFHLPLPHLLCGCVGHFGEILSHRRMPEIWTSWFEGSNIPSPCVELSYPFCSLYVRVYCCSYSGGCSTETRCYVDQVGLKLDM